MKREELKELGLENEVIEKIMSSHGKTVTSIKNELETTKTEKETLTNQLAERDNDIKELQSQTGNSEELKVKLTDLETKYQQDKESFEATIAKTKTDHAVEMALKDNGAKSIKAARALLDFDKIELTDDGIKGLDDQLEAIKTDNDFLFTSTENQEPTAPKIMTGGNPNGQAGTQLTEEEKIKEALGLK